MAELVSELVPSSLCKFCDRQSGSQEHLWPDWICREWVDGKADWAFLRRQGSSPLEWVEQAGREVDVTTACVCSTCNNGWMHRLEDRVSPFMRAMFTGTPTRLDHQRRQHLARWALKTATTFECDAPNSPATPREVCKKIRLLAHPPGGYQVFLAHYVGPRILDHRREVLSGSEDTFPGEHVSFSLLLVGQMLLYIFADPWERHGRAVPARADSFVVPLIEDGIDDFEWPTTTPIDEARFQMMRDPTRWVDLPSLQ